MPAGLDEPGLLDYRYGLVDIHQVDCVGLLAQDNLDALVLAVLCDFGDRKPQEVVTYIVRRLRELLGANERGFRDYMDMLEILSENRDLQAQVEEAEHMLTEINVERLPSFSIGFKRGEDKGKEEGRKEGEEEGLERGLEKGKARVVHRLLSRLSVMEVSELLGLSVEDVERMAATKGDDDLVRALTGDGTNQDQRTQKRGLRGQTVRGSCGCRLTLKRRHRCRRSTGSWKQPIT